MDAGARTAKRVRGVPRPVAEASQNLRRRMTPAERALWKSLRDRRLDDLKFRRQYALGSYILDFCCPSHRLVIEVDGSVHDEPEQRARDEARSELLAAFGYRVLRFRNDEVLGEHETVLNRIRDAATSDLPSQPLRADLTLKPRGATVDR